MIFDKIENAPLYYPMGKKFETALKYIAGTDFSLIPPGRHDIEGGQLFAVISEYETKPPEAGRWEAHKKYTDLQFVFTGRERIGFTSFEKVSVTEEYNADNDIMFLAGEGNFMNLENRFFAILLPHDVHMPGIRIDGPEKVKKVVVKIKM
jgi:YhcH/YjgK/YiaL family protein